MLPIRSGSRVQESIETDSEILEWGRGQDSLEHSSTRLTLHKLLQSLIDKRLERLQALHREAMTDHATLHRMRFLRPGREQALACCGE